MADRIVARQLSCETSSNDETQITRIPVYVLSALIFLIGVATMVWTVRLVIQAYTPAWYSDQWEIPRLLLRTQDHPNLRDLWSQHNEHRIILGRLLSFADIFWFKNAGISLRSEIVAVQILQLIVFGYMCRRWGGFSGATFVAILGMLAYSFFSPLQMENFNWGFQVSFVLVGLAASCAIALLLISEQQSKSSSRQIFLFPLAIIAAAVAEMSMANGLLIWPILVFVSFSLEMNRRRQLILAVSAIVGITAYLIGYHSPGHHANPLESLNHTGIMAKYVLTYFAFSWDASLPNPSYWPHVWESCTVIAIGFVGWLTLRCITMRSQVSPLLQFVTASALFYLGTAVLSAAGRINFGYEQATAGRYQSFALAFWVCVIIAILDVARTSGLRIHSLLYLAVFILLIASLGRLQGVEATEIARKQQLDQGWTALLSGDFDNPLLDSLNPNRTVIRDVYPYLVSHHLISAKVISVKGQNVTITNGLPSCAGWVDSYVPTSDGKIAVSGWAYDYTHGSAADKVALLSTDGKIIDSVGTGILRIDVPKALSNVFSQTTGWTATWPTPAHGTYKVYAIIDGRTDCPLNGSIVVQ